MIRRTGRVQNPKQTEAIYDHYPNGLQRKKKYLSQDKKAEQH